MKTYNAYKETIAPIGLPEESLKVEYRNYALRELKKYVDLVMAEYIRRTEGFTPEELFNEVDTWRVQFGIDASIKGELNG